MPTPEPPKYFFPHTWKFVGLRDFRRRTRAVIADVRENKVTYVLTVRGKPKAIIEPYSEDDRARGN